MRPVARRVVFWLLVLAAAVAIVRWLFPPGPPPILIDQAQLLQDVRDGTIGRVTLPREAVIEVQYAPAPGTTGNGTKAYVAAPPYRDLLAELDQRGVEIEVAPAAGGGLFPLRRFPWLGLLLLVVAWLVRRRNMRLLREAAAGR